MRESKNLMQLLNLNYLRFSNKTNSCGPMDLPAIDCNITDFPDYIALYSERELYTITDNTAVAFFEYDDKIDGKYGLYWAIYYDDKKRLAEFKERFKDVRYVIIPDYSELGDVHRIENEYRLFKGRIVGLWFIFEIGAVVIPNITFPSDRSVDFALNGYENCSVATISTKSHMQNPAKNKRLREHIRLTVDRLPNLSTFIVYDVCSTNDQVYDTFSYAIKKGIRIIIPDNTLKYRHIVRYCSKHGLPLPKAVSL